MKKCVHSKFILIYFSSNSKTQPSPHIEQSHQSQQDGEMDQHIYPNEQRYQPTGRAAFRFPKRPQPMMVRIVHTVMSNECWTLI